MKTATYKLIGLFILMLGATNLLAQDPNNELSTTVPAEENQNMDQVDRLASPGAACAVTFTAYPNPANTVLYVRLTTDPEKQSELKIFNTQWQQVYHKNVTGLTDLTIDIANLAEGMYYVRLTAADNQVLVKKVQILP